MLMELGHPGDDINNNKCRCIKHGNMPQGTQEINKKDSLKHCQCT